MIGDSPKAEREPCSQSPSLLTALPQELLSYIVGQLENSDIKNLRLSCKQLANASALRIKRVFLSANPLNVKVFRAIADHEVFRHGVTEIIYDDAWLPRSAFDAEAVRRPEMLMTNPPAPLDLWDSQYYRRTEGSDEEWFQSARRDNLREIGIHKNHVKGRWGSLARAKEAECEMSYQASWAYYQNLVRQQDEVIACGADIEAFIYGLRRFPSLRTITVTPAAHGMLFCPLYKTPMIRAFPFGFNYPLPRGWPARYESDDPLQAVPWVNEHDEAWAAQIRDNWRGFLLVAHAVAQERQHHRVSEFLIDSNQLHTGIGSRLFEQPCEAYTDIASILELPGLRRFHLSLNVEGQHFFHWKAFRSGLMRDALAKAVDLEQFALETDLDLEEIDEEEPPSLDDFIPIECWPKLQHLKLWNLHVRKSDLLSFLAKLPQTLQSIELSALCFFYYEGGYVDLLQDMHDILGWRERKIQPRVKMAIPHKDSYRDGQTIHVDKEIDEFLYGDGDNPFARESHDGEVPPRGAGVLRDAFVEELELPWKRLPSQVR
ncbi:uncharacterized protein TRIVIDRAFT_184111 [Trichoderma virens Gv29-8]|uniref:F-box domain-containing protein n=1 Tax=Hypocrea virens (strain Gv29-8 / FGSC 10586) TaxID=413071 RepID=G9N9X3_HYPVG|nr:uncharacterized protein TRIVIDRAFT_184111 [Trichoderma virens Gv29-8]EHK16741.1 hypothetical protein TRIVIDRAFT_184111 [Trichoderma virens Gv29-8]